MPIKFILIDSNIWHFTYVKPKENNFEEIHSSAVKFLSSVLIDNNIKIVITTYQIAEIIELLRKNNIEIEKRKRLLNDFKKDKFFIKEITMKNVEELLLKNMISNIHVYDYLVAYPLSGIVDKIYSADDHFQHKDFREIAEVENPLHPWILREGKKPTIQSLQSHAGEIGDGELGKLAGQSFKI